MCYKGLSSKVTLIADAYYVFYLYQSIKCCWKYKDSIYLRMITKQSYSGLAKIIVLKFNFWSFYKRVLSKNSTECLYLNLLLLSVFCIHNKYIHKNGVLTLMFKSFAPK